MNRKNLLVVIVTTLLSIADFPTIANAEFIERIESMSFQTPSGNTGCMFTMDIYVSGRREIGVRCDTRNSTAKMPPRPKDCDGDYGAVASLSLHGKGKVWGCNTDTVFSSEASILQYGSKLSYHGIICTSRRTGLTCINLDKRGWEISQEQRRFF
jgi:hypothetical protein